MLLRNGSRGEQVRQVQQFLSTTTDGIFGPTTERLVREWQLKNNQTPTGVVDTATWNRMFGNIQFNINKLKGHIPDGVINQIIDTARRFNITTSLRLAHFLSQCAHESSNFSIVFENLNYSATRLRQIFPRYFPNNLADQYARQPEKIANRVYCNRMGNGDEVSGDGWLFRGRGYIQLTGKDNYTLFSKFITTDKILDNPDLVATKYPLMSAAFFFNHNKLWSICDRGSDVKTITMLTRRINGGTHGLDDRIRRFNVIYRLLTQ